VSPRPWPGRMAPVGGSWCHVTCAPLETRGRVGELIMACLKRWFVVMAMGVTPIVGLPNCVVAPVAPVSSGYAVSPPVVVVRPPRPYGYDHPYRAYRPYRPYDSWYRYPYRW
jgi:hypothetical protein